MTGESKSSDKWDKGLTRQCVVWILRVGGAMFKLILRQHIKLLETVLTRKFQLLTLAQEDKSLFGAFLCICLLNFRPNS